MYYSLGNQKPTEGWFLFPTVSYLVFAIVLGLQTESSVDDMLFTLALISNALFILTCYRVIMKFRREVAIALGICLWIPICLALGGLYFVGIHLVFTVVPYLIGLCVFFILRKYDYLP